ncbi:TatD family hydrolase [Pedobacter sp. KR3-3]|uniref:TatD family hydrolase n=1 Tax=Pedobacter albus TaxID=3113905 RepID=A0ABU7IAZ9_9SPHI|nr:TatD family hydrolase [Pedobacter sp. KR3-3]MEE1946650.1 TatD family hydrolase [Pedobacter sp. KR3-3]
MQLLDIHTHKVTTNLEAISIQSFSLTEPLPQISINKPISVGLHPWYVTLSNLEGQLAVLTQIAQQPQVKMIGECGLDRLKGEPLANQLVILEKQIALAEQLNKPLILHCVRCFDELMAMKKRLNVQVPMVIHGFNKNAELGQQLLDKGFWLSFGEATLKQEANATKLLIATDRFFLETDEGEAGIASIYEAASNLKKSSLDELKALIFANWKKIGLI